MTRIKETLYRDIAAGKFHETGKLPGVRELAERFNCSRGTVANALKLLANDGIVRLEHGRGTFVEEVKRPPVTKNNRVIGAVLLWYSWMEEMEKVRAKYLKDDWLISLYCSSKDLQNPQEERHFLELAREQNFSGVISTQSPGKSGRNIYIWKVMEKYVYFTCVTIHNGSAIIPNQSAGINCTG